MDEADAPKHSREYNSTLDPSLTYNIYDSSNGTEYASTTYSYGFRSGKGVSLLKFGEKFGKTQKDGQIYNFKPDALEQVSRGHEIISALTDSWVKMKKKKNWAITIISCVKISDRNKMNLLNFSGLFIFAASKVFV